MNYKELKLTNYENSILTTISFDYSSVWTLLDRVKGVKNYLLNSFTKTAWETVCMILYRFMV